MKDAIKKGMAAAGGWAALGRLMGLSRQAVHGWSRVPAERVLEFERVTGVSRHEVRPDIYPKDEMTSEQPRMD